MDAVGKIYPKDTLLFRREVGEAKSEDGKVYELTTSVGHGCPIVRSKQTGKWFSLAWEDVIRLAIAAGVDSE